MILIKPQIDFRGIMPIGLWMQMDYEKVSTVEELIEFTHRWIDEADRTHNEVKRKNIESIAHPLYSIITNKSFESKIL